MTDPDGRIHTFCAAVPGKWHVMGVTQAAGLSLKWFKENFAAELSYREIDERVNKIPILSERLLYLPYLMGERTPHLDPFARGVFFGIFAMHRKEHFMRAVMEGVAFSLRDCFEVLKENNIVINEMAVVGGGSRSAVWGEMLSGVYNMSVRPLNSEGAAFGAAFLTVSPAPIRTRRGILCAKKIRKPLKNMKRLSRKNKNFVFRGNCFRSDGNKKARGAVPAAGGSYCLGRSRSSPVFAIRPLYIRAHT